ncbi:MAG: Asp-tRNA(Asn)/Glu-tRNA(Gln) amidotransferase subunit GatC [Propionibacteriales bacterium]|nr:Asp-tRNA(Asn)/Glu-tRNA(Gln) amidotransferase subunit GatC [Propionibacteriales bacterium]
MSEPATGITREDVAHLANLARIDLDDAELDRFARELPLILDSVAKVQEVAGEDVPAMSHPLPMSNVFRVDEVRPGLTPEEALAAAPKVEQQRFAVPRILGEEA